MDITYRPLRSKDLKLVRELHNKLLPVNYPPSFFLHLLIAPDRTCLLAVDAGIPVAFVSAAIHIPIPPEDQLGPVAPPAPPTIELLTLGVAPAYQHCGLAAILVKRIHDVLRVRIKTRPDTVLTTAHVAVANTRAIAFYKRLGLYVIPDLIRGFYRTASGPQDAYLVMGLL